MNEIVAFVSSRKEGTISNEDLHFLGKRVFSSSSCVRTNWSRKESVKGSREKRGSKRGIRYSAQGHVFFLR